MPNVSMPLSDISSTVSRPVITEVVKQLQDIFSIKYPTIIYPGDIGKAMQPGTSIDKKTRNPRLGTVRHTYVEVTEKLVPDGISSHPGKGSEYEPIFFDPNIEYLMRPVYAFTEVEINFKYSTPSRVEALTWYNDCYTKAGELRQAAFIHSFDYHYNIPKIFIELFHEIYKCRERVGGFNETVDQYFKRYAIPRFTYTTDLVGKSRTLSVTERQGRVVGIVDWGGIPEKPTKNNEQAVWECEFTYKFTYEKPVELNVIYPISVHNQLLPNKFIEFTNHEDNEDKIPKRASISHSSLYYFEVQNVADRYVDRYYEARIPFEDDKVLVYRPSYLTPIFTALCIIDENDPKCFLNLKELGEYSIDKLILEFIEDVEYMYINKEFASIFNIVLYRGNNITSSGNIYVDKDLNVRSFKDINIRVQQRIRFSICNDITLLLPDALIRLMEWHSKTGASLIPLLLLYLNEVSKSNPEVRNIFLNNILTEEDLLRIYGNYKKIMEREGVDTSPFEEVGALFNTSTIGDNDNGKVISGKKKSYRVKDILSMFDISHIGKYVQFNTQMNLFIQARNKGELNANS